MTNRIEEILDLKDECNQINMEFDIFRDVTISFHKKIIFYRDRNIPLIYVVYKSSRSIFSRKLLAEGYPCHNYFVMIIPMNPGYP